MLHHYHVTDLRGRTLFRFRTKSDVVDFLHIERWSPTKIGVSFCKLSGDECASAHPTHSLTSDEEAQLTLLNASIQWDYEEEVRNRRVLKRGRYSEIGSLIEPGHSSQHAY
jgi:hypothetical protein